MVNRKLAVHLSSAFILLLLLFVVANSNRNPKYNLCDFYFVNTLCFKENVTLFIFTITLSDVSRFSYA